MCYYTQDFAGTKHFSVVFAVISILITEQYKRESLIILKFKYKKFRKTASISYIVSNKKKWQTFQKVYMIKKKEEKKKD